jgi:hypothetical protein
VCGVEVHVSPHPCQVLALGHGSIPCFCLGCHPAADSELVWTKGHDKLSAGVTQESHKNLWHKFPMGGQGTSKHREGKVDRDKQGSETGEGACK